MYCYVNEVTLESPSGWGLAAGRTSHVTGGSELSAPPQTSGKERRAEIEFMTHSQCFNQSGLCHEASIKTVTEGVQ